MFPDAVLWVVGGSVGSTGGRGRLVDVDVVGVGVGGDDDDRCC